MGVAKGYKGLRSAIPGQEGDRPFWPLRGLACENGKFLGVQEQRGRTTLGDWKPSWCRGKRPRVLGAESGCAIYRSLSLEAISSCPFAIGLAQGPDPPSSPSYSRDRAVSAHHVGQCRCSALSSTVGERVNRSCEY